MTSEAKETIRVWKEKLASSGFEDIEDDRGQLKKFDSQIFGRRRSLNTPQTFEAKREYFVRAQHLLTFKVYGRRSIFKSKEEQLIWRLHSEGKSIREIVQITKAKRWFIESTIIQFQFIMRTAIQ